MFPCWAAVFIFDLLQQESHTEEGSASGGFQRLLGCQWQCLVLEIFDLNCITWEVCSAICMCLCVLVFFVCLACEVSACTVHL